MQKAKKEKIDLKQLKIWLKGSQKNDKTKAFNFLKKQGIPKDKVLRNLLLNNQENLLYSLNYELLEVLTQVKVLNLAHLQLTTIPTVIWGLKNLQELVISNNRLTQIPPEICALTNLKRLDVSNNKLSILPPDIVTLLKLQHLRLYNNDFTEFPVALTYIKSLENLNLSDNQIKKLPQELIRMHQLQVLVMSNNPLNHQDLTSARQMLPRTKVIS